MTGEVGAAGDMVTGALWSRAVEPQAGEAHARAGYGALCLNCGTRLIGAHCHACGQSVHVHRTVGAIGHELAHGVFHFEGKIWRTLPMLVRHPGALTRRYIDGERARFVSPLALFLFTVFLMFATISWVGPADLGKNLSTGVTGAEKAMAAGRQKNADELARLERRRALTTAAGQPTGELDRLIARRREDAKALDRVMWQLNPAGKERIVVTSNWSWLKHALSDKLHDNPSLLIYKLQSSAYKYSWALIPLSTPFVALLFLWRRRFGFYDHAIFVTYSIAFMTLLVVALTLLGIVGLPGGLIALAALTIPPIHIFAQLRGAYGLRKRSALWRTAAMLVFAVLILTGFALLLVLHGLAE